MFRNVYICNIPTHLWCMSPVELWWLSARNAEVVLYTRHQAQCCKNYKRWNIYPSCRKILSALVEYAQTDVYMLLKHKILFFIILIFSSPYKHFYSVRKEPFQAALSGWLLQVNAFQVFSDKVMVTFLSYEPAVSNWYKAWYAVSVRMTGTCLFTIEL